MSMSSSRLCSLLAGIALGAVITATSAAGQSRTSADHVARGEYLAHIMVCADCHTDGALAGKPDAALRLAGSRIGFRIPELGVFYPPNLTPDRETGLGDWSTDDIIKAVRDGVRPDGRILAPIMPYAHYSALTDGDAQALAAYLKSLKPVRHQVPPIAASGEKAGALYLAVMSD
jgi:mono/diheme cytochrome c family protein